MIELTVNGREMKFDGPLSVSALLSRLSVEPQTVVVELNLNILKRAQFDSTVLNNKDNIEIVRLVGGG
jgi:sulfur carrier protein